MNKKPLYAIVLVLVFFATAYSAIGKGPLHPANLRTEYIENPIGIDASKPRFSWTFTTTSQNQFQSAYELVISNDLRSLETGKNIVWSTGKISSSQNIQIEYAGSPLQSFTRYYWKVRVYNQDNEVSEWSTAAWFETAMLSKDDWQAKWISDGSKEPEKKEDYYKPDPMPLFRKIVEAKKKIAAARLYISGMGYYEAYMNGKKIGDHVLDPGWTTYGKQVLYSVHDITTLLKQGNNIAGIMLGNGWWNPLPLKLFGRWDLHDYQQTGRPCVKAEIHIRYADGTTEKILSDESWQTSPGPITKNNVYLGEHYDARLENKNWLTLNAVVKDWKNASLVSGPSGELTVQMQSPIKVTRIVKPVAITQLSPDTFIVNMGQNFGGVARIKVKGPAGTKITLRYGEGLFSNGSLNVMTTVTAQIKKGGLKGGPGAPETAWQEDSYILKGDGVETWSPRFTFHGFQYVEITGWPGTPTINDIEGLRMNTDLPNNGSFSCSNEFLNKLHDVIQWTFLSNVFSVQSDCPGREKMGYGADIVVTTGAYIYNYDMAHFYSKTVRDYANDQRPLGGMTEIAPFTGIADKGYGDLSGPLGWQLAFPWVQKELYQFYGDRRIIETYYPALQKQISFLRSQATENLFFWDISDHNSVDPRPEAFSAAAFYYHHVLLAAEFAGILNKKEDSIQYATSAASIKRSTTRRYAVPGTGRFDIATQAAQLFALWYDLSAEKENTFNFLLQELERHRGHLSTGIFSTKMFFDVMQQFNRSDIVYRVVNQQDYPSFGYMLSQGATTLWETWQFPETGPSRNHPMFGSVDEWFYRSLAGINPAAPGFKEIIIKPQPAGDLLWVKASYQSVRGTIKSEWEKKGNKFILKVTVPGNVKAFIHIPCTQSNIIKESSSIVKPIRYENGYAVVEKGSGDYIFEVTND